MRLSFQILPFTVRGIWWGETLHFPTNTEEVQSLLKRIGVDGVRCQEYFIISFDSDILGFMTIWASMKTLTSSTIWPIC